MHSYALFAMSNTLATYTLSKDYSLSKASAIDKSPMRPCHTCCNHHICDQWKSNLIQKYVKVWHHGTSTVATLVGEKACLQTK